MSEIRREEQPKNEQSTPDLPVQAGELEPVLEKENYPLVWAEGELNNLAYRLLVESEFLKKIGLRQKAREKGITPEQIFREINQYMINRIKETEKGNIRHFHRTSIDKFRIIAEMGRLVSRSKLKEERPDVKLPGWSANDNVMMTRDIFDSKGNLIIPGVSDNEGVGASGTGATLVFREDIMDSDNYDAIGNYPTVSDLVLKDYCEVVLANSEENKAELEKILEEHNLSIPVFLKSAWSRNKKDKK